MCARVKNLYAFVNVFFERSKKSISSKTEVYFSNKAVINKVVVTHKLSSVPGKACMNASGKVGTGVRRSN